MSDPSRAYSDPAARFFDNYLKLLHKHAIPAKQRSWYVKHVEAFIKAQNGRKIKALSGAYINRHLEGQVLCLTGILRVRSCVLPAERKT
jgi:hypothetical protein